MRPGVPLEVVRVHSCVELTLYLCGNDPYSLVNQFTCVRLRHGGFIWVSLKNTPPNGTQIRSGAWDRSKFN